MFFFKYRKLDDLWERNRNAIANPLLESHVCFFCLLVDGYTISISHVVDHSFTNGIKSFGNKRNKERTRIKSIIKYIYS